MTKWPEKISFQLQPYFTKIRIISNATSLDLFAFFVVLFLLSVKQCIIHHALRPTTSIVERPPPSLFWLFTFFSSSKLVRAVFGGRFDPVGIVNSWLLVENKAIATKSKWSRFLSNCINVIKFSSSINRSWRCLWGDFSRCNYSSVKDRKSFEIYKTISTILYYYVCVGVCTLRTKVLVLSSISGKSPHSTTTIFFFFNAERWVKGSENSLTNCPELLLKQF